MADFGGLKKALGAAAAVAAILLLAFGAEAQDAKKSPAKAPSACKGLAEAACKGKAECAWITPSKGKQKPYCRTKGKGRTKAKAK